MNKFSNFKIHRRIFSHCLFYFIFAVFLFFLCAYVSFLLLLWLLLCIYVHGWFCSHCLPFSFLPSSLLIGYVYNCFADHLSFCVSEDDCCVCVAFCFITTIVTYISHLWLCAWVTCSSEYALTLYALLSHQHLCHKNEPCVYIYINQCLLTPGLFFSLRHFGHWNISVICLRVILKLTVTVIFSPYLQTFWPKWLKFFQLFQKHFGLFLLLVFLPCVLF